MSASETLKNENLGEGEISINDGGIIIWELFTIVEEKNPSTQH